MLEQDGVDLHRSELQCLFAQIAKQQSRRKFADRHRKIHALHLGRDGALDGEVSLVGAE